MEKIFDIVLSSFDFGYLLAVNILTYLIIKIIDELNGDKAVPTWLKRTIAVIDGLILIGALYIIKVEITSVYLYSFIGSLVSWDVVFKPLLKFYKNLDYKKHDDHPGL